MDDILKIKNLNFNYNNHTIFNDLNLSLVHNEWYTLLGNNHSGKTTLVKIISGLIECQNEIEFDHLTLNRKNINKIRAKLSILFTNLNSNFLFDDVYDEITYELKNLKISEQEIKKRLDNINKITNIKSIIDQKISQLTNFDKIKVLLTSALITQPKLLIIDETFSSLNSTDRKKVYELIQKYKSKSKLTVLNISNNPEDILISDNVLILECGQILMNEKVKLVFTNGLLEQEKYKLPFVVELSEYLKLYNLIDKNYTSIEELTEALWK